MGIKDAFEKAFCEELLKFACGDKNSFDGKDEGEIRLNIAFWAAGWAMDRCALACYDHPGFNAESLEGLIRKLAKEL